MIDSEVTNLKSTSIEVNLADFRTSENFSRIDFLDLVSQQTSTPNTSILSSNLSIEIENHPSNAISKISEKLEQKYGGNEFQDGGKKKKVFLREQDFYEIARGYDTSDSFVDDSEAVEVVVPCTIKPQCASFYINCGQVLCEKQVDFMTKRPLKPVISVPLNPNSEKNYTTPKIENQQEIKVITKNLSNTHDYKIVSTPKRIKKQDSITSKFSPKMVLKKRKRSENRSLSSTGSSVMQSIPIPLPLPADLPIPLSTQNIVKTPISNKTTDTNRMITPRLKPAENTQLYVPALEHAVSNTTGIEPFVAPNKSKQEIISQSNKSHGKNKVSNSAGSKSSNSKTKEKKSQKHLTSTTVKMVADSIQQKQSKSSAKITQQVQMAPQIPQAFFQQMLNSNTINALQTIPVNQLLNFQLQHQQNPQFIQPMTFPRPQTVINPSVTTTQVLNTVHSNIQTTNQLSNQTAALSNTNSYPKPQTIGTPNSNYVQSSNYHQNQLTPNFLAKSSTSPQPNIISGISRNISNLQPTVVIPTLQRNISPSQHTSQPVIYAAISPSQQLNVSPSIYRNVSPSSQQPNLTSNIQTSNSSSPRSHSNEGQSELDVKPNIKNFSDNFKPSFQNSFINTPSNQLCSTSQIMRKISPKSAYNTNRLAPSISIQKITYQPNSETSETILNPQITLPHPKSPKKQISRSGHTQTNNTPPQYVSSTNLTIPAQIPASISNNLHPKDLTLLLHSLHTAVQPFLTVNTESTPSQLNDYAELRGHLLAKIYAYLIRLGDDGIEKQILSHIAELLQYKKSTDHFKKKLGKIFLQQMNARLATPLQNLKEEVLKQMEINMQNYEQAQEAQIEKTIEGQTNKVRLRKNFKWTDELKTLLGQAVVAKIDLERNGFGISPEGTQSVNIVLNFLDEHVKPIWPKGWVNKTKLFDQSHAFHKHFTFVPNRKSRKTVVFAESEKSGSNSENDNAKLPEKVSTITTTPEIASSTVHMTSNFLTDQYLTPKIEQDTTSMFQTVAGNFPSSFAKIHTTNAIQPQFFPSFVSSAPLNFAELNESDSNHSNSAIEFRDRDSVNIIAIPPGQFHNPTAVIPQQLPSTIIHMKTSKSSNNNNNNNNNNNSYVNAQP